MRFSITFFFGLVAYAAALPTAALTGDVIEGRAPQNRVPPGTPVADTQGVKLRKGESCTTTSTKGVLGCQDGTGGTFNIVNGRRQRRSLPVEARAPQNRVPPGTPVADTQGVKLRKGESCTTTSTKGVLGCQDGTGGTFNIVNGRRQRRALPVESRSPQTNGTPVTDTQGVKLRKGESCATTSTKGVLGCQDGTGNTFNIVNGQRRNLKRDDNEIEAEAVAEPGEELDDAAAQGTEDQEEEEGDE
ncbi:hypothetical protein RB595_008579 [Gaeumannomyces hyphopodioides]